MRPCPKAGCRNLDPARRKKGQYITDTLPEPFAIITYLKAWPGSKGHSNKRSVCFRIFYRNNSGMITFRTVNSLPFKDVMVLKCPGNDCRLYWQSGPPRGADERMGVMMRFPEVAERFRECESRIQVKSQDC